MPDVDHLLAVLIVGPAFRGITFDQVKLILGEPVALLIDEHALAAVLDRTLLVRPDLGLADRLEIECAIRSTAVRWLDQRLALHHLAEAWATGLPVARLRQIAAEAFGQSLGAAQLTQVASEVFGSVSGVTTQAVLTIIAAEVFAKITRAPLSRPFLWIAM